MNNILKDDEQSRCYDGRSCGGECGKEGKNGDTKRGPPRIDRNWREEDRDEGATRGRKKKAEHPVAC